MLNTTLGRLRAIGTLEGVSFLLLLGIAMPLKYLAGLPQMVRVVGMIHGVLFLLFVAAVLDAGVRLRWPAGRILLALISSLVPFGPFLLDSHLRREGVAG
ncbi:MAG TPA: DUF3817 domain-containing protein [Longimicrobium sp.]|nr:DUF3817 domain-containing protein [Longimicrobium sp.]